MPSIPTLSTLCVQRILNTLDDKRITTALPYVPGDVLSDIVKGNETYM